MTEPPGGDLAYRTGRLEAELREYKIATRAEVRELGRELAATREELIMLRTGVAIGRWLGPMVASLGTGLLIALSAHYLA